MGEFRSLIAPLHKCFNHRKNTMKRKTHTKKLLAAVSVAGLILSSTTAHAEAIYTWLGTVDDDWENADNWDDNGIPVDTFPDTPALDLRTAEGNIIIQGAAPTDNIPTFSGGNAFSNTNESTPQIQMRLGTMTVNVETWRGRGLVHRGPWSSSVGSAGGNGLAVLNYNVIQGTSQGLNRDNNSLMDWTVHANGTLNISTSASTLQMAYSSSRTIGFNLPGGTLNFVDSALELEGYVGNFFDFTAPGASVTANFGGDFPDLNSVNTAISDDIHFISSTSLDLVAVDNGDDTFTVTPMAIGSPFPLTITQNASTPGTFDFEWDSQPGKIYDLLTSTDLATPISEWPIYDDGVTVYESIPSAGETTTRTAVPSSDPRRFFAMRETDAPPPPPLFAVDFEEDNGGFTASTDEGTAWEWGTPDSSGPGGTVDAGNDADPGTGRAWGTNLGAYDDGAGDPGFYANPTTNSRLISPDIDLTEVAAAELTFAQAIDLDPNDSAVVRIYDAGTGDEIVGGDFPLTVTDPNLTEAPWEASGPHTLPVGSTIRIEWIILNGTGGALADYTGWYIDDVVVTETTP